MCRRRFPQLGSPEWAINHGLARVSHFQCQIMSLISISQPRGEVKSTPLQLVSIIVRACKPRWKMRHFGCDPRLLFDKYFFNDFFARRFLSFRVYCGGGERKIIFLHAALSFAFSSFRSKNWVYISPTVFGCGESNYFSMEKDFPSVTVAKAKSKATLPHKVSSYSVLTQQRPRPTRKSYDQHV